MHDDVVSDSFINKRSAQIEKHIEYAWIVDNMNPEKNVCGFDFGFELNFAFLSKWGKLRS